MPIATFYRRLAAALLLVLSLSLLTNGRTLAAASPDAVSVPLAAHSSATIRVVGYSLRFGGTGGSSLALSPILPDQRLRNVLFYGITWGYASSSPEQVAAALWYMGDGQWHTATHEAAQRIVETASSGMLPASSPLGSNLLTALVGGRVQASVSFAPGNPSGTGSLVIENRSDFAQTYYLPYGSALNGADGQPAYLIYAVEGAASQLPTSTPAQPTATTAAQASPTASSTIAAQASPAASSTPTVGGNPALPTASPTATSAGGSAMPSPEATKDGGKVGSDVLTNTPTPSVTPVPATQTPLPATQTPLPPTSTPPLPTAPPASPTDTPQPTNTAQASLPATAAPEIAAPSSNPVAPVGVAAASLPQQPVPTALPTVEVPLAQSTGEPNAQPPPQVTGEPAVTPGKTIITPTTTATLVPGLPTFPPTAAPGLPTIPPGLPTGTGPFPPRPTIVATAALSGSSAAATVAALPPAVATAEAIRAALPPTITAAEATATIASLNPGTKPDPGTAVTDPGRQPAAGDSGATSNPSTVNNTQPSTGQAQNDNTLLLILAVVAVIAIVGGVAVRVLAGRKK